MPTQPGIGIEPQQRGVAGVGECHDRHEPREPGESRYRILVRRQALSGSGEPGHSRRVNATHMVSHCSGRFSVDDLAIDVGPVAGSDALLLALDAMHPFCLQHAEKLFVRGWHSLSKRRPHASWLIYQRSQNIEEDYVDVADLNMCALLAGPSPVKPVTTLLGTLMFCQRCDVSFAFLSGDAALDLAATVGSRRDDAEDLLRAPADLERWVRECPGLPDELPVDEAGFPLALSLREAIYKLALDRVLSRPFDPDSVRILNDTAAVPGPVVALTESDMRVFGDLPAVPSQLARSAIAVLPDRQAPLKECGRTGCTRIYVDRSRGSRRTWCGMAECGNRVKAAAYRARKIATPSS